MTQQQEQKFEGSYNGVEGSFTFVPKQPEQQQQQQPNQHPTQHPTQQPAPTQPVIVQQQQQDGGASTQQQQPSVQQQPTQQQQQTQQQPTQQQQLNTQQQQTQQQKPTPSGNAVVVIGNPAANQTQQPLTEAAILGMSDADIIKNTDAIKAFIDSH